MMHVKSIRNLIELGDTSKAMAALENLLALGPNNLEALKMKASLFSAEGRYHEEALVWAKIAQVDREDVDAVSYYLKQQLEDREHYYFTDDLPSGGRRFMAYPRRLVSMSLLGLFGCVFFLSLGRFSQRFPVLAEESVILLNFFLLVLMPWMGILFYFFKSIKSLSVTPQGVELHTRLKRQKYSWQELEKVSLAHQFVGASSDLVLALVPSDLDKRCILLDMNDWSSSIRARSHLVREISKYYDKLSFDRIEDLKLSRLRCRRY